MKFRAAILTELGTPLVIDEIESAPLRFGQVLVRIVCTGVCGAQLNEIDGVKGPDRFLPHLLGHEATATVVELGEGVTSVATGDRVVCHWRKGAGVQAPPASYTSARGTINAGWVTTFSEYAVVSENRVTRIPSTFDAESGALLGCAVTTALGVVHHEARLGIGESVVVFGAGGVGLSVVQFAAMVGAFPIIAVDLHQSRLDLARALGATHVLDARSGTLRDDIRRISGGAPDVAIENTGVASVIEMAYDITGAQGRVILVGVPAKAAAHPQLYTLPLHFGKLVVGSEGGASRPALDIPRIVRLCDSGRLSLRALVGKRYALDEINDAIDDMRAGTVAGRCMIWMNAAERAAAQSA